MTVLTTSKEHFEAGKKVIEISENSASQPAKVAQGLVTNEGKYDTLMGYYLPSSGLKFRQQVSSLLGSLSQPYKKHQNLERFLEVLKDHLLGLPSTELLPLETSRQRLSREGIRIPLSDPIDPVQWKFSFIPPTDVVVVGSWSLKNGIKSTKGKKKHVITDLLVQMPSGVLQEKDYLSNRYFHKRAHYLAHIAASFLKSSFSSNYDFNYSYVDGNSFKPIMEISPKEEAQSSSPKWTTRIMLSYPQSTFPLTKLSPSKANLKPSLKPSPQYNQSILIESTELNLRHLKFFTQVSDKYPAFTQACQLLKAWAKQKVFYRTSTASMECSTLVGFERFGWLVNFLVAHVLLGGGRQLGKKGALGSAILQSDPAALWKHVIDWLAKWDPQSIIGMKTMDGCEPFPDEEFRSFGSALIDPTGTINLISGIPLGALNLLCSSAARTALLLKSNYDVFDALFLRKSAYSFASSFDYHFIIKISSQDVDRLCKEHEAKTIENALQVLTDHLQQALGNRVIGFALLRPPRFEPIRTHPAVPNPPTVVQLGFKLNPTHAFNLVTYGPSPEISTQEVEDFRLFWGARSDLRRFQDGSIKECVNWPVNNPLERLQIIKQIVRWLLIDKLGFADRDETVWNFIGGLDPFILENPDQVAKIYEKDPKELGFTNVMKTFNEFVKQLKALNENDFLPLAITSVQPTSEHLRYSSVFIPGPRKLKDFRHQSGATKYLPSFCCQLKFASSGKWPESLEAIQKIKAALLSKIAEGLRQNRQAIKSELVFDYKALPITQNVALDVLHCSGYAFKLAICYEREEMLLEAAASRDSQTREEPECQVLWALEGVNIYRKMFVAARKHHDAITALQTRFPSFTYTVRLIKRWFSSHMMLSTHISIELVELLASVVYLLCQDDLPPTTGSAGFICFLKFIKRWNWRSEPILIPLETSIGLDSNLLAHFPDESVRSSIEHFDGMRKKDPGFHQHTYFVATEYDLEGSEWMLGQSGPDQKVGHQPHRPSRVIADRIQILANASLDVLEPAIEQGLTALNPKMVFKSPLKEYDFHLVLDLSLHTRLHQSLDSVKGLDALPSAPAENCVVSDANGLEVDDDPVLEFVKELQWLYGDTIEFFYDQFGGPIIAGIFNLPLISQPKPMKIGQHEYLSKPIEQIAGGRRKVVLDGDGSLEEIVQGVGRGVVCKVLRKGTDY